MLRYQILNIENEGNLQKGTEKYENFIADCREYFLEILVRIKEVDFIKNELSIIKNEEIRNVNLFLKIHYFRSKLQTFFPISSFLPVRQRVFLPLQLAD